MNTIKCGDCKFYDPILAREEKETKRGWCIKKSVYPTKEGPGQVFPEDAQRHTDSKKLGQPCIVKKESIIQQCLYARAGRYQVERKKDAQANLDSTKQGQRILR